MKNHRNNNNLISKNTIIISKKSDYKNIMENSSEYCNNYKNNKIKSYNDIKDWKN
jgi:hypothetical protein